MDFKVTESTKIIKNYMFNQRHCLGEGSFGKVYEGIDSKTQEVVAIKTIDQEIFKNYQYLQVAINAEIEILKRFNHKNIVKFKDIVNQDGIIYIVTEFCKDGDLKQFMKANKNISEEAISEIFKQILEGIKELHKVGVIHRDLKPANILIHNHEFKIADFGFARDVDFQSEKLLVSCVGSPMYMDPLILSQKPYGTKCDIWSLGVILYEFLMGETPFYRSRTEQELLMNIFTKPLKFDHPNKKISQKMQNLIKHMLQIQEADRISWEELFNHFGITDEASNINVENLFQCLLNEKNRMSFKHFISVDLVQKYQKNKRYGNKESIYDKFLFYLSLSVKKESEKLLQVVMENEQKNQQIYKKNQNLIAISNSLKREHSYYQTIFDDIYNQLIRNGLQNTVFNENQIGYTIDKKNLNDNDFNNLNIYTFTTAKTIAQQLLESISKCMIDNPPINDEETQNYLDTLVTINYIIDLISIEQLIKVNSDIPFEQYHEEKSFHESPQQYLILLEKKFSNFS